MGRERSEGVVWETYRLEGKGVLRRLVLSIGLNDAICSSDGPGTCIEDDGSTSSESSVMPLKVDALRLELRRWIFRYLHILTGVDRKTGSMLWDAILASALVERQQMWFVSVGTITYMYCR